MRQRLLFLLPIVFLTLPVLLFSQPQIELTSYATGFTRPLDIVHCGDSRLFIVEQRGYIWILDSLGNRLPNPFLNIDPRVRSTENERGLLGLAFPPDYAETGFFYVNYTRETDGDTRVSRFSVKSDNPNEADPDSEVILLTQDQPFNNHNAGCLKFGPDGYLYIAFGDGGSGGDPQNNGQKKNSFLGKILRIDVSSSSPGLDYAIPADNPFVSDPNFLSEIWSWGWRNPWRFSFDRLTGDMWVGDVGQVTREEIDFEPAGLGGRNYGWRCYEGTFPYNTSNCQPQSSYTGPVFDYDNNSVGCSVTGGFIYRGSKYIDLYGVYLFTDYCSGRWWAIRQLPDGTFNTVQLVDLSNNQYAGLGEDRDGELYVAALAQGAIYKITEKCSAFQLEANISNASCHGTMDGSIELDITGGQGPYTFSWAGGQTGTLLTNLDPGIYIVEAQDNQNCIRRDTFEVGANDPIQAPEITASSWTAPLPNPELLCAGTDTVLLEANAAPLGFGYQWYINNEVLAGATEQQLAVSQPGIYQMEYTGSPCNSALSAEKVIALATDLPIPLIQASDPAVLCPGGQITLDVINTLSAYTLQWFNANGAIPGETGTQLTVTEAGVYSVQFKYKDCLLPMSALVVVTSEAEIPGGLGLLYDNSILTINAGSWFSYQWLLNGNPIPNATAPSYMPDETGFYECQLVSINGCTYQPGLQVVVTSTVLPESVKQFQLAPNPTSGTLRMTLHLQKTEQVKLVLLDAQRRQLFAKSVQGQRMEEEIDLSQLPAGTYYLSVQLESGSFVRSVVRR